MRTDDSRQRAGDEVGRSLAPSARGPIARLSPEMLRVQQVRLCTGRGGQVLHAGRQSRLRAGLAQVAEEFGGHDDGAQGEGGETSQEQGLNGPPGGWHRFVSSCLLLFRFLWRFEFVFRSKEIRVCVT